MTTVGTSYFVTLDAAVQYYRDYHYPSTVAAVIRKLADGEIHLGRPNLKQGERLITLDGGTRYGIQRGDV